MTDVLTLQAQLSALNAAIAVGATVVTYDGGRRVEYRSLSEMFRIRDHLQNQIAAAAGGSGSRRRTVASFDNGF
jgi:hypothetical protein